MRGRRETESMQAINWASVFFLLLAGLACAFAIAVVVTGNIVRMAFYLVLSLAATSGLFFLAGADFVGAMQLLIYVGGTLVLLIFGVMLTSQAPFINMRTGSGELLIALALGGTIFGVLAFAAFSIPEWRNGELAAVGPSLPSQTAGPIGMGLLGARVDAESIDDDKAGYLLVFEIISVHLLVVLVGAAYLARAKRRRDALAA